MTTTHHNIIKWVGTIVTAISAILISFSPTLSQLPTTFSGYLIGALIWLFYAVRTRDWALAGLNAFYLFVNSCAVVVRL